MQPKLKTRAAMLTEIEVLKASIAQYQQSAETGRREKQQVADQAKQLRDHLDEVKEKLARTGAELQRLRGYVERVQEDDIVREELVQVGDPAGEQRLVPKRQHAPPAQSFYGGPVGGGMGDAGNFPSSLRDAAAPRRPRHWVTY